MKERMNQYSTQLKRLWNRVRVTSKTLLDKGKTQARKLKPYCQRGKEALAKAWKCLCRWAGELSANTQDLFLKVVTWFFHSAKVLANLLVMLAVDVWMGIFGLVALLLTKVKALYQYLRSRKAVCVPAVLEEHVDAEPVAELTEAETPEICPILVEGVEESAIPVVSEVRPRKRNFFRQVWKGLCAIGRAIRNTVKWIWRLRGLLMSLPVAVAALKLAYANMGRLPEVVGLDIQASGEFARTVSREMAVYGPLALTAFCLLLTVSSKKPLFPWVISVFSLVLPPLIWFLNYYA